VVAEGHRVQCLPISWTPWSPRKTEWYAGMVKGVQIVDRVVDVLVRVSVSVCALCRCSGLRQSVRSFTVRTLR